ncbi:uncharacterized protein [Mytilus edulis]|uniref:uncharacterized protein n=1 Tax=Mytilus edulis TaxID=6550 RepID=UPI0039F045E2
MDLSDTFLADIEGPGSSEKAIIRPTYVNNNVIMPWPDVNSHSLNRKNFLEEQNKDPEVLQLCKRAQPQEEADKVAECYFHQDGILVRKWGPPDATLEEEWRVVYQVVVPKVYRQEIIGFAHDTPLAGHLGIRKTCLKILQQFYWPRRRNDVAEYCKSCHICQVVVMFLFVNAFDHFERLKAQHVPEIVSYIEDSDHLENSISEHGPELVPNIENSDIPDQIKLMKEDDVRLYHEIIKNGDIAVRHYFRVIIIGKENAGKTSLTKKLVWERPDNVTKLHDKNEIDIHRKKCTLSVNDGSWLPPSLESERECGQKLQIALENRKIGSPETFALDKDIQYVSDTTSVDINDRYPEISTLTNEEILLNETDSSDLQSSDDHICSIRDDERTLLNAENALSSSDLKALENTLTKDDKGNLDADFSRVEEFKKLLENVHLDLLESATIGNNETTNKDIVSFSLWDFEGDSEFYGTFQAFLSSCAVYLLVVNAFEDINASKSKSRDYIKRWFNIFHCFCSALKNTKEKGRICKTQNPPVIAVGTNTDRFKLEELDEKTNTFRDELCNIARNASSENTGTLREVFVCSTTSDDNGMFDEIRKEISKHIKRLPGWGVKVPVRWVVLEEFLRKLKANGTFILQLQVLIEIARDKRIGISDYKELLLFLHFNHEVGNIIFFADDDLEDYVILDPKWLAQAFRCFMTDRHKLSVRVMATKDFQKLQVTGEMSDLIISELLSSNQYYNFVTHKSYLLKVMNKFDILMKYRNTDLKDVLYMPFMIQDTNWQNVCTYFATEKNKKSSWLCFEFEFLPPAFFNHILCIFIRKYEVSMFMLDNKQMSAISRTFGLFDLDTSGRELVVLRTFENVIAIQLWTHTDTNMDPLNEAEKLRKSLQYYISKVSIKYRLHVDYNIYPKCRSGDFTQSGKKVFSELEKISHLKCLEHNVMHDTDDLYLPWYPVQKRNQNQILPDKVIVAAIDFGTANSGYAYCNKSDFKESGFNAKIYCKHWKIHGKVTYKSPTSVLFNPDKSFHSFGFEAEEFYREKSDSIDFTKWYFFRNFKMLLYKDILTKDTFISDIRNAGKDMLAVDVFGAVINYFKNHLLKDLTLPGNQTFDNEYVHWVITVPAIWDYEARHFMAEAAKKANIKLDQLTIVAEPEAASFYCRTVPTEVKSTSCGNKQIALMQKGSQYIVLDQGGKLQTDNTL